MRVLSDSLNRRTVSSETVINAFQGKMDRRQKVRNLRGWSYKKAHKLCVQHETGQSFYEQQEVV